MTQRVLAAHPGVASAAEPWVLLPLLSPLVPRSGLSGTWDQTVAGALGDFISVLPNGSDDYRAEVREMVLNLYGKVGGDGSKFFVDKTPPYHLIADEVIATFPDARFIFLWRNPLAVLASIIETLGQGKWTTYEFRGTLFDGVRNLVTTYERHRDRVHGVRYEDLLAGSGAWESLCEYVGLPFDPGALSSFSDVHWAGRMGDPTGVHRYTALSNEPLVRWRGTIVNPLRREWARRWLRWIGPEHLSTMGYEMTELLADLDGTDVTRQRMRQDAGELMLAAAREVIKAQLPGYQPRSSWRALISA